MTSSLRKSQENSIIKTDHGDSIRDSELQTHQTPTDTIMDRKGISELIYHAPIYTIIDKLITNQGSKVKRSVGGHVTIRRTWYIFYGPCRRQKTAIWPIDHQCVPQRPHPAEIPYIDQTISSVVHHLDGSVGGNSKNSYSKFEEVRIRWANELSMLLYSTVVVNMASERVSHHIALPLYIGQLAMYIKYFLCGYIIFRLTT
jgi:hypothetical protein